MATTGEEHTGSSIVHPKPTRKTPAENLEGRYVKYNKQSIVDAIEKGISKAKNKSDKAKWEKRLRELNKVKEGEPGYKNNISRLMSEINMERLDILEQHEINDKRKKQGELLRKMESEPLSVEEITLLENINKEIARHELSKAATEEVLQVTRKK